MVDPITLVISTIFGGVIVMVAVGFYLLEHRSRTATASTYAQYGPRGYYSQYSSRESAQQQEPRRSYSYDSHRPFRTDAEIEAEARRVRSNARMVLIAIVVLVFAAVIVAGYYDPANLILLVFLLPIVISFLRSRRARNEPRNGDPET